MEFAELAQAYARLEETSKRLEMREILVRLILDATPSELPEVLYLSQGLLRPEYEGVELGLADALALKAVAQVCGLSEEEVRKHVAKSGDLGSTVAELAQDRPRPSAAAGPVSVHEVYAEFLALAKASGEGSQETKVSTLVGLLGRLGPTEAKYAVRFALGRLRLGVREMSILDALAAAFGGGAKEAKGRIEAAFNVSSDLGMVATALAGSGLAGLGEIHLEVGRPVRPMLAEREKGLPEILKRLGGRAALEYKYDGLRIQAHVPAEGEARLFSRRLENITAQFPELVRELPRALRRRPAIVEGECVPVDPDTEEIRPFQEVSRRRGRKYDLERLQEEVPVRLFLFDLLLDSEGAAVDQTLPERRKRLEAILRESERVHLARHIVVESASAAQEFFDESIAAGCEGILAKSITAGSTYRAGARGFWWIKYKRDYTQGLADSIDGVVVGAFLGRGRRAGLYGALLMAVYNDKADRFESFCKVGSGFDDATLAELPKRLDPYLRPDPPPKILTGLTPDRWFDPRIVLEIKGAELSLSPNHSAGKGVIRADSGLALRFPRFTGRFREDKGPRDATTVHELVELYRQQVKQPTTSSAGD